MDISVHNELLEAEHVGAPTFTMANVADILDVSIHDVVHMTVHGHGPRWAMVDGQPRFTFRDLYEYLDERRARRRDA